MELRKGQLGLQVNESGIWQWVFCYDERNRICTTKTAHKALPDHALDYFRARFADHDFRLEKVA